MNTKQNESGAQDELRAEYDLAALPTILRGPGRRGTQRADDWAICLPPPGEAALIACKIYQIHASPNPHRVWVTNEDGARQLYPSVWFLPLSLSELRTLIPSRSTDKEVESGLSIDLLPTPLRFSPVSLSSRN